MTIPPAKSRLLEEIVAALAHVPKLQAIALGGSYARGTARASSDLDIGLYYRVEDPFEIDEIAQIARRFSASGKPTVTDFYSWGPFVNGGAWIDDPVCKVDFLYRNLDQLERIVQEAKAGIWTHSFDQQPPFGFRSVTTLGEIHCCKPLFDPRNVLGPLKASVAEYPSALKATIIQDTLWCADFSFQIADGFANNGDVPNSVACMTRIFHYLVQALYALNETYFMNDKRMREEVDAFAFVPPMFGERAGAVLGHAGQDADALRRSLQSLYELYSETVTLAGDLYRPKF